ncbi:MAG: hypothetical protein ACK5NT_02600 [Pyrinomonadaceae bacterium]
MKRLRLTLLSIFTILGLCGIGFAYYTFFSSSANAAVLSVDQDTNEPEYITAGNIPLQIEQPDNTPFRILNANADIITAKEYQTLTGKSPTSPNIISKPRVLFENTSNKLVTGFVVMTFDRARGTKFGLYIKDQKIEPTQRILISPNNFVRNNQNPASDPSFWMNVEDVNAIGVRVVVFFGDGSSWVSESNSKGGKK